MQCQNRRLHVRYLFEEVYKEQHTCKTYHHLPIVPLNYYEIKEKEKQACMSGIAVSAVKKLREIKSKLVSSGSLYSSRLSWERVELFIFYQTH